jgi:hypothetical protein
MIDLIFLTEDPTRREISRRYYATNKRDRFVEDVSEIASDHGLTWKQVLSVARSSCIALSTVHQCTVCGKPKEFTSRKEVRNYQSVKSHTCDRHAEPHIQDADRHPNTPPSDSEDAFANRNPLQKRVRLLAESLTSVSAELEKLSAEL